MPATPQKSRRILRLPAVIDRTGLSRTAIYDGVKAGRFPRPINITERAVGWIEQEVDDFLDRCAALRDEGPTSAARAPAEARDSAITSAT